MPSSESVARTTGIVRHSPTRYAKETRAYTVEAARSSLRHQIDVEQKAFNLVTLVR